VLQFDCDGLQYAHGVLSEITRFAARPPLGSEKASSQKIAGPIQNHDSSGANLPRLSGRWNQAGW
jgi:hypothetical protein